MQTKTLMIIRRWFQLDGSGRQRKGGAFDYQDCDSETILVILIVNFLVMIIFDNFANEDADDNTN